MTISIDLLSAINHLCTHMESKILFAAIYYDGTTPSFAQVQQITGITQPNHYFKARKELVGRGYLYLDAGGMHINADVILEDFKC